MKLISSKLTVISKKVVPALILGVLMIFAGGALLDGTAWRNPAYLLGIGFVAVVLLFLTYFLVGELADEVFDDGDYLVVKRGSQEERIPLANIMNVNVINARQLQITLRLVTPGKFGASVTFLPETSFSLDPFAKNQVAEALIVRVDRARRKNAV